MEPTPLKKRRVQRDDPTVAESYDPLPGCTSRCKNPQCRSGNVAHDWEAGDIVCTDCGWIVQERVLDPGKDWRACDTEDGEATRMGDMTAGSLAGQLRDAHGQLSIQFRDTKFANCTRVKMTDTLSERDKLLPTVTKAMERFAGLLTVSLDSKIVYLATEFVVRLRTSPAVQTRGGPAANLASLWLVSYLSRAFVVDEDFVRVLTLECMDASAEKAAARSAASEAAKAADMHAVKKAARATAEKDYRKAKEMLRNALETEKSLKQLTESIKSSVNQDELKWRTGLFRRFVGELAGDSVQFRAAEVGARIMELLKRAQVCNGERQQVRSAVAVFIILNSPTLRKDAPAAAPPTPVPAAEPARKRPRARVQSEQQFGAAAVHPARVAAAFGVSEDSLRALLGKLEASPQYRPQNLVDEALRRIKKDQELARSAAAQQTPQLAR
eukprot:TRINITY_DN4871_c0_g1_i1.p1 TRINITY_DN4871_c0_g1~~TRINITY_DN4871_c0_g1_i1.p1  ORF type:complete len:441 (+),score=17.57 TRINITY_DN4871_c0_g1_i1:103-1425(+)